MFPSLSLSLCSPPLLRSNTAASPLPPLIIPPHLSPIFAFLSSTFCPIPSVPKKKGGPVLPGLPEVQAGGRLGPLLPGIHGPQPGRSRSPVHLLRWGRRGEPGRRRRSGGPGQQRRGLRRHQRLPASGLLRSFWGGVWVKLPVFPNVERGLYGFFHTNNHRVKNQPQPRGST